MTDKLILEPKEHKYFLNGKSIPGLHEILKNAGFEFFENVRPNVLTASQKFGTALHKACELWDKNDLAMDMLSEPLKPYLEGWIKFRKYFEIWTIEESIYSKRWWFATTPDRTGIFAGALADLEIKTDNENKAITTLQTAGHLIALKERYPEKRIKKRYAVILSPNKYRIEEYKDKSDEEVFIACCQIYPFKKKHNLIGG